MQVECSKSTKSTSKGSAFLLTFLFIFCIFTKHYKNGEILKKITILLVLFAVLLLSSCANLFSPPFDARLEGTWKGTTTEVTKIKETDFFGNEYIVTTTKSTTEKYTFYNATEVKRERAWFKDVSSNDASTSFSGGNGTYNYEWKNLRDNYDIDLTNIESGTISIDGFELTKQ